MKSCSKLPTYGSQTNYVQCTIKKKSISKCIKINNTFLRKGVSCNKLKSCGI